VETLAGLLAFAWLIITLSLVLTFIGPARRAIARGILAPCHIPLRRARWVLGVSAGALFIAVGITAPPEKQSAPSGSATVTAPEPVVSPSAPAEETRPEQVNDKKSDTTVPEATSPAQQPSPALTQEDVLNARFALCAAVNDEYSDVLARHKDKDASVLASQYAWRDERPDENTCTKIPMVKSQYLAYLRSEWTESDCATLYTWRKNDEKIWGGDPISLKAGEIKTVVDFNADPVWAKLAGCPEY
jgi:hypothetical protein